MYTMYKGNKPIGTFDCPDWDIETATNGNLYLKGKCKENQYILNNEFVDMPERPSDLHYWDWDSLNWVLDDSCWVEIRYKRDQILLATDWTQLPDVSDVIRLKYQKYRQSLRDITQQPIKSVVFPTLE